MAECRNVVRVWIRIVRSKSVTEKRLWLSFMNTLDKLKVRTSARCELMTGAIEDG